MLEVELINARMRPNASTERTLDKNPTKRKFKSSGSEANINKIQQLDSVELYDSSDYKSG